MNAKPAFAKTRSSRSAFDVSWVSIQPVQEVCGVVERIACGDTEAMTTCMTPVPICTAGVSFCWRDREHRSGEHRDQPYRSDPHTAVRFLCGPRFGWGARASIISVIHSNDNGSSESPAPSLASGPSATSKPHDIGPCGARPSFF